MTTTNTLPNTMPAIPSPISAREKWCYGIGDLASGMVMFTAISTLMFFYTEMAGLPAALVGTLLFAARAWDAVWDVLVGVLVDRTRTRWGQARPYILGGSLLLAASWVACFSVTLLPPQARLAYACVTYVALMMSFSLVNIPYAALPALMSPLPDDRLRLAGTRAFFALSAGIVVSALLVPLANLLGDPVNGATSPAGYQRAVLVLALLCLALHLACFLNTRERVAIPLGAPQVGADLRMLARAPVWWQMLLMSVVGLTASMLPVSAALYYYRYAVGNAGAAPLFFICTGSGAIAGVLLSDQLTRRICKRRVAVFAKIVAGAVWGSLYLVPPGQVLLGYAVATSAACIGAMSAPVLWSVPGDVADHVELRSGRRLAGLSASTIAFAGKLGIGLASLAVGAVLGLVGYRPDAVQTPEARQGIVAMMSLLPMCGFIVAGLIIARSPIGRAQLDDLAQRLHAQRQAALVAPAAATAAASA